MVTALMTGANSCGVRDLQGQRVGQRGEGEGEDGDEREADEDAGQRGAQTHRDGRQHQQHGLEDEQRDVPQHPPEQQRQAG